MRLISKFQDGGVAPTPIPAEQQAPQGDPMEQLVMAAMTAVQNQDPNMAMEVCMMLLELAGVAPGQAPVGAEQGQPVFRKGGKMKRKSAKRC